MEKAIQILVVEDDPDLGTMIKLMLELKGFAVTLPERIEQTGQILRNNNIDLVLMDMLLSGANGMNICTQLKSGNETKHIPVMMISAHPEAKALCLGAGADDFISKPFDMQDLILKVNTLVYKSKKA
jgi:DNA-binding response OmpR family regulator